VDDDGHTVLVRDGELRGERRPLAVARRVIVVVIEPAFTDGDGAAGQLGADGVGVARVIEFRGVVRMNARGVPDEPGMRLRDAAGARGRGDGFSDADDPCGTRLARPGDDLGSVGVEGRVGEVGVAVDEAAQERRNAAGQLAGGVPLPNAWSG
jgi:hypothetical protein